MIRNKEKLTKDYSENFPMHWQAQDYWDEWDEGCELWLDGWLDGEDFRFICRMPRFIKKIYLAWLGLDVGFDG